MKRILLGLVLLIGLQSCKEIIATNIGESLPSLILPQVNDTVAENPVQFKWNEIEGATKYHLEIAKPSFAAIQSFVVDSSVANTSIFLSLDSNEYELKLTAMNAGYESHTLGPIKFWVGVQPSSNSGLVSLSSPAEAEYFNLNNYSGQFTWQDISDASFEFSLRKGASYVSTDIKETVSGLTSNQHTSSINLDEGEYHWGVRAYFNTGGETNVATRKFYIDTVKPNVPALTAPTGSVSPGEITFTWTTAADEGVIMSPIESFIEVAEDINFTIGVQTDTVSGSSTSFILNGSGTRYWRVKNTDAAGNISIFSPIAEFILF